MTTLDACAAAVVAFFDPLITLLEKQATVLGAHITAESTYAAVEREVRPWALSVLDATACMGAGFVAAPGVLADAQWYLSWWQGENREQLDTTRYVSVDYTNNEWYRVPAQTGSPHIAGPYVDYLCTRENALTVAVPTMNEHGFVGVVGADILVRDFEAAILPAFRGAEAILVNGDQRLVMSTDPTLAPGTLIAPQRYSHRVPCGELPLAILG